MKKRIDQLLVDLNICETREKAKRNIMAGNVSSNNQVINKPGTLVDENSDIRLKKEEIPYVSRGGLKLEKALREFEIDLTDKTCIDIGASTGGFTDCMLKHGANKVYSVDVGYGQLDWKLRNDPRVVCMERTNIRYADEQLFTDKITFASIDVSFISLRLVLPVAAKIIEEASDIIALIKPQFEAGREEVKKHGVVKDKNVHMRVINEIISYASDNRLYLYNLSFSPVTGPKGNIEFLAHFIKQNEVSEHTSTENKVIEIVEKAHLTLYNKSI